AATTWTTGRRCSIRKSDAHTRRCDGHTRRCDGSAHGIQNLLRHRVDLLHHGRAARVTPTMVDATKSCCLLHAVASVTTDMPASSAIALKRAVDASVFSLTNRFTIAACRAGLAIVG